MTYEIVYIFSPQSVDFPGLCLVVKKPSFRYAQVNTVCAAGGGVMITKL